MKVWMILKSESIGPTNGGESGPYVQSERLEIYRRYADVLIKATNGKKGYL